MYIDTTIRRSIYLLCTIKHSHRATCKSLSVSLTCWAHLTRTDLQNTKYLHLSSGPPARRNTTVAGVTKNLSPSPRLVARPAPPRLACSLSESFASRFFFCWREAVDTNLSAMSGGGGGGGGGCRGHPGGGGADDAAEVYDDSGRNPGEVVDRLVSRGMRLTLLSSSSSFSSSSSSGRHPRLAMEMARRARLAHRTRMSG